MCSWYSASPCSSLPRARARSICSRPTFAIAPRQEHQRAQEPRGRRRDVGVVPVHAHPEIGIVERRVEFDARVRARGGCVFRHERLTTSRPAARATAPGRRTPRPGRTTLRHSCRRARPMPLSRRSRDPPRSRTRCRGRGCRDRVGSATRARWQRGPRTPRAAPVGRHAAARRRPGRSGLRESHRRPARGRRRREGPRGRGCVAIDGDRERRREHQEPGNAPHRHVMLVRNCCFAAWRSMASATRRSTSSV